MVLPGRPSMMRTACLLVFLVLFLSPLMGIALSKRGAARRGVSLCGAEFGAEKADFSNENPGKYGPDYSYNSERTVAYFCDQGLRLLRLPFRWERIQPRLGKALDRTELGRLRKAVGHAR